MRLPQDRILHIDTEFKDCKVNIVAEWQGELVRCKDCKYLYMDNGCPLRTWHTHVLDDYCSYGEKRIDGTDVD